MRPFYNNSLPSFAAMRERGNGVNKITFYCKKKISCRKFYDMTSREYFFFFFSALFYLDSCDDRDLACKSAVLCYQQSSEQENDFKLIKVHVNKCFISFSAGEKS